jgi:hypothetical protein
MDTMCQPGRTMEIIESGTCAIMENGTYGYYGKWNLWELWKMELVDIMENKTCGNYGKWNL